jgi:Sulfotransferase domain
MERSSARRMLDFVAVGPPRTATTWLHNVLQGHLGLPERTKETHFFGRNYGRGLDWYTSHFRHCAAEPVVGEVCASYFEDPQARERMAIHLPEIKIICTLREPVARLYSYYKLMRQKGRSAAFEEALSRHRQMLECSRYAYHVREWQNQFGIQNVLVMLNDDLERDSQDYLDQITSFIGIPSITLETSIAESKRDNSFETAPRSAWLAYKARRFRFWLGSRQLYRTRGFLNQVGVWDFCFGGGEAYPPLDPSLKSRLRQLLRPEVEALEQLLQRDLSQWKEERRPLPQPLPPQGSEHEADR